MNQFITKTPLIILGLFLTLISSFSLNKTLWPNRLALKSEDKMHCIEFQNLNGSNRINEFLKLSSIFNNQSSFELKSETISPKQTIYKEELEILLGSPKVILNDGSWVYKLNSSIDKPEAIFSFSEDELSSVHIVKQ
jgi:hypothetical protein